MQTIAQLLALARSRLGAEAGPLEAEVLLAHVLSVGRTYLIAHPEQIPADEQQRRFGNLLAQRIAGIPVAYLLGEREFWSLPLAVTPATLIPRPDTELLVELAVAWLQPDSIADVLDLGTGSGAIALAIASERPGCRVQAVDISADALAIARRNANRHQLHNVAFLHGAWFSPLGDQQFDLIVSNPPYVAENDPHLDRGDAAAEPRLALAAGPDGLDALRRIIAAAPRHLRDGGKLLLEHGHDQRLAVEKLLAGAGFCDIRDHRDYGGNDRACEAHWHGTGS